MSDKNDFTSVIKSLLEGTDGMLCAKTVVGNAIRVGETILIPASTQEIYIKPSEKGVKFLETYV